MKQYIFSAVIILAGLTADAQGVGIGTVAPHASSILELSTTSKGFLVPRMTTANRTAITSPAAGLQVYDTTTNTFWYYNGTVWVNSGAGGGDNLGNHSATQALALNDFALQLRGSGDNNHKLIYSSTINGPLITGFGGGVLGTAAAGVDTPILSWKSSGNVGIGTTDPKERLNVAEDITSFTDKGQIIASGATDDAKRMILGYNTTSNNGFIQSVHMNVAYTNLLLQPRGANVGIGTNTPSSKLEVNGSSTNTVAYNAGSGTNIDFSQSNLAYTTANAGTAAFALLNIKNGGTYTLSVRGTTSGTAAFTGPSGYTVKYANNRATTAGTETLYTIIVMGTTVYVYTATGF